MTSTQIHKWQFWVDRGGTFTDIVAKAPDGVLHTHKLLSDNPEQYQDAALAGMRFLLGLKPDALIPAEQVSSVKMGTTVATNALLERKGEPTVFVTSKGFKDALEIGYQNRPRLFERHIQRPELLYQKVIEANERISHQGDVLTALDSQQLSIDLQQAFEQGLRSVAIVFLHGYRHHQHEQMAERIAKQIGFEQISCSYQVSPMIKFVSRGDTTVVDAYLSPILRRYVEQICTQMPGVPLYFMQSSGGLSDAQQFQGKDAILSGPAGGIVGMARTAEIAGFGKVIGFDMGGTSTDVSHYAGEFEREFETQVAGIRMRAPMMRIHTVAAGGGSILYYDGARLRVGPESAGANPGPACYRRGGPLTVTDANVLLGKIQPEFFPHVFGAEANKPLDKKTVTDKFAELSGQTGLTNEALAEGFIRIAVQQMANAIKKISVARGYDVTAYLMQCFGGAGAQHACLVADVLGIKQILIHPFAGVLSAYGMGLADQSLIKEQSLDCALEQGNMSLIGHALQALSKEAEMALNQHYVDAGDVEIKQRVHVRYQDSDTALIVPFADLTSTKASFECAYKQQFSFLMTEKALVVEMVSAEVVLKTSVIQEPDQPLTSNRTVEIDETVDVYMAGCWQQAGLLRRDSLQAGDVISGPAILIENNSTTIIEPGWTANISSKRHVLLQKQAILEKAERVSLQADPVMLEVFNNLFMNIAEQMGLQLQNTALSVNIKERLDFSCALFDEAGNLIANAPHVPVHLGSMGESIKSIINANQGKIEAGDVFLLNDPYHGGTHLPDMTVITPVFLAGHRAPVFYVGSRGHHADVGGKTPGSIPAFSSHIDEEGIRIANFKLVSRGKLQQDALLTLLNSGQYPARNPAQNLADLSAQIAANEKGVQELTRMVEHYGLDVVQAYMQHVQDNAETAVRNVIHRLNDGDFEVRLDNGSVVHVAITVDQQARQATIDFSGTSAQQNTNFNAPKAVAIAAVLYVFRTLVDDDIPLNAGCLKPLQIIIPEGSMLNPVYPAAVVAGNVETSTCITNALYGALGVMASAQPTMNNLTFGNQSYQYYETLAGGSGAGALFDEGELVGGFNGTSVVQSLMTNSRLTDPEVLESRYPVRVIQHTIETGSGGLGRWNGGDGARRRLQFLEPMTVSILSNGRCFPAFGLAGGQPGQPGKNRVIRATGEQEELAGCEETFVDTGDTIEIITPGGGAFGEA
ncbi:hydantoinase B/oxoprolinase family protein [Methylophaga thiooxydans]|uniref:Hydantoinase/oxoprolinase domain family protein n=1 Tax=Methylophaga thiooxydans DMS010 TaxID=637616 RepID=C0N5E8_9GAMM|nr:hydantoinase B/oxoprolinase family protein [Methylophaga thiooxydans]EEF79838.1 Hydantoinase/oxoprolinase domain family protein [Methylophaga thiooxydans DMS010]